MNDYISSSNAGIAQLVERNLAKVDVAGSSPVSRSKRPIPDPSQREAFLFSLPFGEDR